MANIKDELTKRMAEKWSENNGIVMRTILAMYKRGYFRLKELSQVISAYKISLDDILDALDYFDDLGYIEVKDGDTNELTHTYDTEDIYSVKFRLTAIGTRLGNGKIKDDGVDL